MPIVSIMPAGNAGIILDVPPAELPSTAWSDGLNARFSKGAVTPMQGDYVQANTTAWQGYMLTPGPDTVGNTAQWLIFGLAKAKAWVANTLTDITRVSGDYTGQASNRWNTTTLNGVVIANNGVDIPQAWLTPTAATKLTDLANWPSTARAAVIRSFKQFLVALDITKSTTRYPTTVKWSHPADPGAVPVSWNEADPTKDAGETPLSETLGECIDCLSLKDINIIYKTDSVWGMQYTGGPFVFRFYKIFGDWGMPVRDCAVEYVSGKHLVFTGVDLVTHDGVNVQSVVSGRMRNLLRRIRPDQIALCYMVLHAEEEEVWFCFRQAGDAIQAADTAIVYNWIENTLSLRALPDYKFIATGSLDPTPTAESTWQNVTGTWLSKIGAWGFNSVKPLRRKLLGIGIEQLIAVDDYYTQLPLTLQREQLGVAMKAQQAPDMSAVKFLSRVWPRITGTDGDIVSISLGYSMGVNQDTVWESPKPYIIGTSVKVDCTLTGRTFGVKVESQGTEEWKLAGLDAEVKLVGGN